MHISARVVAVLAALMMVAGPAVADHTAPGEPFVPVYVETPVYLHCNGAVKANNVHAVAQSTFVSWDENQPTASYTTGAGCGYADTFLTGAADHNPIYDFPIQGTFEGNIDNLTIRFWAIDVSGSRALDEFTVNLHVQINGQDIIARGTEAHAPVINSSTGVSRLYEVTVTSVGFNSLQAHNTVHNIQITAHTKFIDGSGVLAWVYDAAEIDSGLVINDTTPAAIQIPRNG